MGRLIVEQIVSVDGFAAAEDRSIDFFAASGADPTETTDEQLAVMAHVDAIVLGAATYRMFSAFWPGADPALEPMAVPIAERPKHVFSSTLAAAPWGRHPEATIEREDATTRVPGLLSEYRGDVIVWGSLILSRALFAADLVDELRLRTLPVLLGSGIPSAAGLPAARRLRLTAQHAYPGGIVSSTWSLR